MTSAMRNREKETEREFKTKKREERGREWEKKQGEIRNKGVLRHGMPRRQQGLGRGASKIFSKD